MSIAQFRLLADAEESARMSPRRPFSGPSASTDTRQAQVVAKTRVACGHATNPTTEIALEHPAPPKFTQNALE
jgi:hypothetical protein